MAKNIYSQHTSTRTPVAQTQPLPDTNQVQNNAGGYGWQVDDWARLLRFLILGSEGGTYYTGERELTLDNVSAVKRCVEADGLRTVNTVVEVSDKGRAIKNEPALYVLALCAAAPDEATRKAALSALDKVARTGTHLFTFLEMVQEMRGWGRGLTRAVSNWYNNKTVDNAAYQMIKYRQRNGWTHRDALRLAHPNQANDSLFVWALGGYYSEPNAVVTANSKNKLTEAEAIAETAKRRSKQASALTELAESVPLVKGYLKIQESETAKEAAAVIADYNLPREAVPTQFLKSKEVWEAMLPTMPLTALIRNLGNLGAAGVLVPNMPAVREVVQKLTNKEYLHKSRVHPVSVLIALKTYEQGRGTLGSNNWQVVPQVVDALNEAFYAAFANVEPTGKRFLMGIDVSASMGQAVSGVPSLSCSVAAASLAMVTMRTESNYAVMAFDNGIRDVGLTASQQLSEVHRRIDSLNGGGTDCSLPMLYALQKRIPVDVFVVITDNETWAGSMHPSQALNKYREEMGIPAKLAVMAMTASPFSIADPKDVGMLDLVGFDSAVPQALAEFARM